MAAAQYYEQVQQAYLAYYGRPADPAGQAYWANQLNNAGGNLSAIINAFGTSAESTALYGGSSTAAQVNSIYQTLFGRSADVAGLNYYVSGIASGQFTLASVALNIFNGATGNDATELTAKQTYADAFTSAVSQSASAQIAYAGTAASTNARAAVAGVTNSTTEAAAAANLSTTIANIGTGTVGQTFALTTGVDTIALTGNNNVVNGTIGAGTTAANTGTFSVGDKITGTGTGNVLNIVDVSGGTALPGATTVSGVQTVNLTSGAATGTANFSGFTGLTQLNVTEAGGATGITAAGTTAVTLTDSALDTGAAGVGTLRTSIVENGGSNVSVTANGVIGNNAAYTTGVAGQAGQISVGQTTAATGTVTVTENVAATATGSVFADAINVKGGTTVTVTANLSGQAGVGTTVTGGAIGVTGTATTTTVTVNQTAAATAANAQAAVAGLSNTVLVGAAAPGLQAVAATTQTAAALAKAAVAGVVDGVVTITDANAASTTLANTITSVSLANFGNGSAINDNALTSLSLTGGTGTLTLTNNATAPTNTALALSLNGVGSVSAATGAPTYVTFADAKNEVTTLNVTTATADSYLTITDTKLAAINVSGTNTLNLSAVPATVKTIAVSGSAGFNDSGAPGALLSLGTLAGDAALTSFTTTSSGKIVATLNDTTQTFVGSTGQDVITISADATKAITGGSATNNEVVFNAAATVFNAGTGATANLTNTNVTGFSVFGLGANAGAATWDLSKFNSSFKAIDITAANTGNNVSDTIVNAAAGSSLNISGTGVDTGSVSLSYADVNGSTDTASLTIGSGALPLNFNIAGVTLQDANGVGINTVNVTTSGVDAGNLGGALDTIGTLTDNGLSVLNVSGTAGLTIGVLNEAAHQATSFTINSTESGQNGTTISALTDINLGSLTFTGTANADVANLVVAGGTVTNLTITNSGTGTATVGDGTAFADAALAKLTLTGNVGFGANSLTAPAATGVTTGFTLSGATDNAHVNINLTGAIGNGVTDTITLGNGNDFVTDGSVNGTVKVTVGTGSNLIDLHTGTGAGYSASVTLGAHTAADSILVGTVQASANAANTVIAGAVKGDIITIADGAFAAIAQATTTQQTTIGGAATFAAALTAADTGLAQHSALAFQYGGNTYVVENSTAAAGTGVLATGDTLVQLTGAHTVGSTITLGHFALTA